MRRGDHLGTYGSAEFHMNEDKWWRFDGCLSQKEWLYDGVVVTKASVDGKVVTMLIPG